MRPDSKMTLQRAARHQFRRWWSRLFFFVLFVLAPVLDLLRYDLDRGHAYLLGREWRIGLDAVAAGPADAVAAGLAVLLGLLLPLFGVAAAVLVIAYRWGRLYCGWLCPHFTVVEWLNGLMIKASGRPTVWESAPLPGAPPPRRVYWLWTGLAALGMAFLWAVVLLTYLLPPAEIYGNLAGGELTANQARFIGVATAVLLVEFTLARHLFCRFGCAVGMMQSLAWWANGRGLMPRFDRSRSGACRACDQACDNVCPMRLNPRGGRPRMATCTQCALCVEACARVQRDNPHGALINWYARSRDEDADQSSLLTVREPRRWKNG